MVARYRLIWHSQPCTFLYMWAWGKEEESGESSHWIRTHGSTTLWMKRTQSSERLLSLETAAILAAYDLLTPTIPNL